MTDSEQDRIKLERLLNFNIGLVEDDLDSVATKKQKMARDPMSHRIIEKRRRDRMNNCLADLSQLIPASYLKQGQGRIEKTEIIEMAIKHIKHMQSQLLAFVGDEKFCCKQSFFQGFEQCRQHAVQYLVEQAGMPSEDPVFVGLSTCLRMHTRKVKPVLPQTANDTTRISQLMGADSSVAGKLALDLQSASPVTKADWLPAVPISTVTRPAADKPVESSSSTNQESMSHQQFLSFIFKEDSMDFANSTITDMSENKTEKYFSTSDSGVSSMRHARLGGHHTQTSSSDENSSIKRMDSESGQRSVYKFKNDIQLRFHGNTSSKSGMDGNDKEQLQASASQQNADSLLTENKNLCDNDKDDFKDPLPKNGDTSSDLASVGYGSSSSSNGNNRNGSVASGYSSGNSGDSGNGSTADSLNNTVPAFALHPTGVYYIPLVLPISQVLPFIKHHRPMGICHPISIPVSFSGPFQIGPPQSSDNCLVSTHENGKPTKRGNSSTEGKSHSKKHCRAQSD